MRGGWTEREEEEAEGGAEEEEEGAALSVYHRERGSVLEGKAIGTPH